jgi:CHAD domain-containing protein
MKPTGLMILFSPVSDRWLDETPMAQELSRPVQSQDVPLIEPGMPAHAAFIPLAHPHMQAALSCARALEHESDPEYLHQLRVSLRRLRALLWIYAPLLGQDAVKSWSVPLREIASVAGQTRDWDVLIGTSLPAVQLRDDPAVTGLLEDLQVIRNQALEASRKAIVRADLQQVFDTSIVEIGAALTYAASTLTLAQLIKNRMARAGAIVRRRAKRACRTHGVDLEALHQTRIAVKRLNYLMDFMSPLPDAASRRLQRLLAKLQRRLGVLNDLVTGLKLLAARSASSRSGPALRLTAPLDTRDDARQGATTRRLKRDLRQRVACQARRVRKRLTRALEKRRFTL